MDAAAKTTQSLTEEILPKQPYYLSLSPTRKYRIPPDDERFDEHDIKALQYTTLVGGEADRGVLITRAFFDVRDELLAANKASLSATPKLDPNKPRKKVSLKDWKNKKVEGDSPPKSDDKPNGLAPIKEKEENKRPLEATTKNMDGHRDAKKSIPHSKLEAVRHRSPSPNRRKRLSEADDGHKVMKRPRIDEHTSNGATPRAAKDGVSSKSMRDSATGRAEARALNVPNGRSASSSMAHRAASPRPGSLPNGHPKNMPNGHSTHKRVVSSGEPVSQAVPKLLSPLRIPDLDLGSDKPPRPSPKKKPADTTVLKPPLKKLRPDVEPSPGPKKRKTPVLPPLLSPTLPPIVMEELARLEKQTATPLKEYSQKSSQASGSPDGSKHATKGAKREETIHVDSKTKREEPTEFLVTMKYKKRQAKVIERLLNLPSKKRSEGIKKEDRAPPENTNGVEQSSARKRPRTGTDTNEASKRPRASDAPRPSTPPKQSTAMARIASNSSHAGTPGAANSATPSIQISAEKSRPAIDPEKMQEAQKLFTRHKYYMGIGRQLKHERDAIMKPKVPIKEREHQIAVSAGVQCLLLYMYAVRLESDALNIQQMPQRAQAWRELLPVCRMVRMDCNKNAPLSALVVRIEGIFMSHLGRALCTQHPDAETSKRQMEASKEEHNVWRAADNARRKLGVFNGHSSSPDGGTVGKLIDRLGPWTSPEDLIPIVLEALRRTIRPDGNPWKPNDELAKLEQLTSNGTSSRH
ncbi:hypothetical protein F5Y16DRAFT_316256 [Xylariaceae sp. FL0255]|nr:hypothetical protein F5Y16DRAFT_316256 [Xylariaceae sp. FL0255]